MIAKTTAKVALNTSELTQHKLREQMKERIRKYGAASGDVINMRLEELDAEWDIERLLETNAAGLVIAGLALSALRDRRWLILPGVVSGMLLSYNLFGWAPPVMLMRRLGFRTSQEIDQERYALKFLRGDYDTILEPGSSAPLRAEQLMRVIER